GRTSVRERCRAGCSVLRHSVSLAARGGGAAAAPFPFDRSFNSSDRGATMHRRDGFTLIELLIVVVIIGILAAIAANLFWGAKEQAFKSALVSDLKVLAVLQEQYHA